MLRLLILTFLLISCSTYKPSTSTEVLEIEQTYVLLIQNIQDENGFIDYTHCDSLLHTGLLGVHKDINVNIEAAKDNNDQWFRRPLDYTECYESNESRSTISRDMLLGLIWYSVANDRLDILEDLWDYGVNHGWVMGEDDTGGFHTIMNTKMIGLLARSIEYLGGSTGFWAKTPLTFNSKCDGYVCHLVALQLGLKAKLQGFVTESELKVLEDLTKKSPNNILFLTLYSKYSDADFSKVFNLIKSIYPPNRLPNNMDWCDDWRVQRDDDDSGLLPCRTTKQHSGGELLFVLAIIRS